MRKLSDREDSVTFSLSMPENDRDALQQKANEMFNGNRSLAIRYALKKTFGVGTVDLRALRHTGDYEPPA